MAVLCNAGPAKCAGAFHSAAQNNLRGLVNYFDYIWFHFSTVYM